MARIFLFRRIDYTLPYNGLKKVASMFGFCFVVMLFQANSPLMAQSQRVSKQYNLSDGVALSGYDAVAYFVSNKAVKGNAGFKATLNGAVYYFSSRQNLETFNKTPQKYLPHYGGWCAYAMGTKGEKVEVNPETYKIVDGRLYLFYNKYFTNTLTSWNKDESNLKMKADANWKKIIQ